MDQTIFETKYASVKEKLGVAKNDYDFKTKEETWDNIGTNPLDLAFTELSSLYLEASETQRNFIFAEAAREKYLYDLWYFIRRTAKLINSQSDSRWLEIGLAASKIDGARTDFRDLIVSLVILRFSAENHGIDSKSYFDYAIQNSDDKLKPMLTNARDHKESDVHYTVQIFGWKELMDESKTKFGEHPSIGEARQRREKNPQPVKQVNCSAILIAIFLVIVLAILYFALPR